MQQIFRNENRIRAGWRLLLQALLLLVLLFSIVGLTQQLPWPFFERGNVAMTVAVLGSVYLAGRVLDKRPFSHFGFHFNRRWWLDFGFGLGVGTAVLTTIFGILWAMGWIRIVEFGVDAPLFAPLIIWSWVNYVLGFPVSGTDVVASFLEIDVTGPAVWTGGDFGPEAGLVCLAVCILYSGVVAAWIRWRRSHENLMAFRTRSAALRAGCLGVRNLASCLSRTLCLKARFLGRPRNDNCMTNFFFILFWVFPALVTRNDNCKWRLKK
ncbi:MAG: hypothetical protein DWQ04_31935 [Chloroflexi bacterium]|nr:MAG: hypothetical protein DWQ04_31935 [Chloroflexota bacterium]